MGKGKTSIKLLISLVSAPRGNPEICQFFLLCSTTEHKCKNWLFSDTPKGAKASAAIYSIVETAIANDINVRDYLEYLFIVMPTQG